MTKKRKQPPKMSLYDLLYDIKINGNVHSAEYLIKVPEVKQLVKKWMLKLGANKPYAIKALMFQFVLVRYKFEEEFTEERFLHQLNKHLGYYLVGLDSNED